MSERPSLPSRSLATSPLTIRAPNVVRGRQAPNPVPSAHRQPLGAASRATAEASAVTNSS
jgi:hypothetical protein